MVNREELVFAACYQLASAIVEAWDNIPAHIAEALDGLQDIDEPGESLRSTFFTVSPAFLDLSVSEAEPESFRRRRRLNEARIAVEVFTLVLNNSADWNDADAETYKKELRKRVSDYTDIITKITTRSPFISHIKL